MTMIVRAAFAATIALIAMRPDTSAQAQRGLFGSYPVLQPPIFQPMYRRPYQRYQPPRYMVLPRHEMTPMRKPRAAKARKALPDAPPKGTPKPQGPLTIVVSLARQNVKVYDNSGLFDEARISSGTATHPTPTGIFSIIQKNKHHRSNLYSNAPMPYMQRVTWTGIALHEGPLPGYPASHGCIRLPQEFAVKLWSWTRLGARVVITNDEVAPVDVAHRTLVAASGMMEIADAAGEQPTRTAEADIARPASDAQPEGAATPQDAPFSEHLTWAHVPSPRPNGHLSLFVSRHDKRLYVRQGFMPWFDVPIEIRDAGNAIGTHVFSALPVEGDAAALRWSALTIPDAPKPPKVRVRRGKKPPVVAKPAMAPRVTAAEALDRIDLPAAALERIGSAWKPGTSLVVSDQGLGAETGRGTDFIVVTH